MQKPLKVIGIDQRTNKYIWKALITLYFFSLSTNGLNELWKLLPTVFSYHSMRPDWINICLNGMPTVLFVAWLSFLIYKYRIKSQERTDTLDQAVVPPHKGIVLGLSKPNGKTPEEICQLIAETPETQLQLLYETQSIGQSLKALYHHRDHLRHVWLIRTKSDDPNKSSDPYIECIKAFIEKFIKSAQIRTEISCIIATERDAEVIDRTKQILSRIYDHDYLSELELKRSDVIVDITGGTRTMGVGMTFGALDSSINIQYVEQRSQENKIIPLLITPMSVMDKTLEYLENLYVETMKKEKRGVNA